MMKRPLTDDQCKRLLPLICIALLGVSFLFQAGCSSLPRPFDVAFDPSSSGLFNTRDHFDRQARWSGGGGP